MTNEIAIRNIDEAGKVAQALAASGFYKDAQTTAQALVKVMAGVELGIAPIAAMSGIHIIEGKAALGSNLIAAQIQRSGIYKYRIIENSATVCKIEFFEKEAEKWVSVGFSEFTIEMATRAGLMAKRDPNPWKKYPESMLFARAISSGARFYCPSVFAGPVYTPEELRDDDTAKTIDVAHEEVKAPAAAAAETKQPETKKAESSQPAASAEPVTPPAAPPKDKTLPPNDLMKQIQEISSSLALTNEERKTIRDRAATWNKATAEKNLAGMRKEVEARKAAGKQPGQAEYLATLLEQNTDLFLPNEVMNIMSDLNAAPSFEVAAQIIAHIVGESNERRKAKNSHAKKKTAAEEMVETPVVDAVLVEDENPFK